MITPIEVGGKGKARKGTVASGGIDKKSYLGKENRESPTSLGVGGCRTGNKVEDRKATIGVPAGMSIRT
jgi:bZIP-type transcription factor MBZ1